MKMHKNVRSYRIRSYVGLIYVVETSLYFKKETTGTIILKTLVALMRLDIHTHSNHV
jgi:hypothetical protein